MDTVLNPILMKALGSLVRAALMLIVPALVSQGIWTPEEATATVASLGAAIVAVIWSLYEKYRSQKKLVTALAAPAGTTERQVEKLVDTKATPSVMLPKDVAPSVLVNFGAAKGEGKA